MASKIRRWLRELAVWLLIGAAVSLAVDYFRQPALPQNVSATSLQTLDGRTLDLNAMSQQKPLLLYVWATWCGVCRYTTPSVEKWLTRKKLTLPTVNDPSGQLARQWDIQVTPTLVVISQGEVKSVTTGWTSSWGMRLRLWLASW